MVALLAVTVTAAVGGVWAAIRRDPTSAVVRFVAAASAAAVAVVIVVDESFDWGFVIAWVGDGCTGLPEPLPLVWILVTGITFVGVAALTVGATTRPWRWRRLCRFLTLGMVAASVFLTYVWNFRA